MDASKTDAMYTIKCWWAGMVVQQLSVVGSQLKTTLEEIEYKLMKGNITHDSVGVKFILTELCIDIHHASGGYFKRHDIKI